MILDRNGSAQIDLSREERPLRRIPLVPGPEREGQQRVDLTGSLRHQ
jgi:hypothetical protein